LATVLLIGAATFYRKTLFYETYYRLLNQMGHIIDFQHTHTHRHTHTHTHTHTQTYTQTKHTHRHKYRETDRQEHTLESVHFKIASERIKIIRVNYKSYKKKF
jgi:hypothetical protein